MKGPDQALELRLPEMRREGLSEGCLGTIGEDETHLKTWRSIIRYFREHTTSGVWVMNPSSKARGVYKDHRYSTGIAELNGSGLQLLSCAGGNLMLIDEPE